LGNKNLLSFPTAGKFVAHAPDFHWNLKISPKKYYEISASIWKEISFQKEI
jgi:hypothetical protein